MLLLKKISDNPETPVENLVQTVQFFILSVRNNRFFQTTLGNLEEDSSMKHQKLAENHAKTSWHIPPCSPFCPFGAA